jgi:hypothetical protein
VTTLRVDGAGRLRRATLLALAGVLLVGCCPDPRSTDGAPSSDGISTSGVRLSTLQGQLFDRHCVTDCHEGASAASALQLARGRSYGNLVNQRSQQIATQIRVIPGDPGASYLVKKMVGGVGIVGDQMPKLAPPRPQAEIDALRAWISRGAPND